MRVIEGIKIFTELRIMLGRGELVPREYMSPDYSFGYDCSCGQAHALKETRYVMCARPIKFFFMCPNNIMTFVRVKGIFTLKSIPEWCAQGAEFMDTMSRFVNSDENCGVFYDATIDNGNTRFVTLDNFDQT